MAANPQWQGDTFAVPRRARIERTNSGSEWEKSIIHRIAAHDTDALTQLYDRYAGLVFGLAASVLADQQLAEDVTQEVFLQVWRNSGLFHAERGSLGTWLAVMARHRAIDILRRKRRECEIDFDGPAKGSLQKQIELSQVGAKIAALVPSMPEAQRIALGLAYYCGLTHSEISALIGEPLGTVKSRIRLALEFLRKALVNPAGDKFRAQSDPTSEVERK